MTEPTRHTDIDSAPPAGAVRRPVQRWRGGALRRLDDHVAEEVPVAFVYNDVPFAVMMATPTDLEDFARGFALSEGIVETPAEVAIEGVEQFIDCLLYTSPSPRDRTRSRMPSSA